MNKIAVVFVLGAQVYVTWITVAIYIVPFALLSGAYGRICLVVWRSVMSKEPSMREGKSAWKKGPVSRENGSTSSVESAKS